MFLYHVTTPDWIRAGATRLALHQYVRPPAGEEFRDHAPLNLALMDNPGKHVYRAFFFDDERNASAAWIRERAILRVRVDHPSLAGFVRVDDDRYTGGRIFYAVDTVSPVAAGSWKIHPAFGIPLADMDIRTKSGGEWQPLTSWLRTPAPVENYYDHELTQEPEGDCPQPR